MLAACSVCASAVMLASASRQFFIAPHYNAVAGLPYNCSSQEIYLSGLASDAAACLTRCQSNASCSIFAWSSASTECYFRLDGIWADRDTLMPSAHSTSGCLLGGSVRSCGKNPINPAPSPPGPHPGPHPHPPPPPVNPPPSEWLDRIATGQMLYTTDDERDVPHIAGGGGQTYWGWRASVANGVVGTIVDSGTVFLVGTFNGPDVSTTKEYAANFSAAGARPHLAKVFLR